MGVLLVSGLVVWAIACYFLHGSAILMYIGIQAITSGIFAWEMCRIEKTTQSKRPAVVTDPGQKKNAA